MAKIPDQNAILKAIETLKSAQSIDIQRLGYHFQPNDFYTPLNNLVFLENNRDLWDKLSIPVGIDWNVEGQRAIAREVGNFVEELRDIPDQPPQGPIQFCWQNNFWNNADALVQYGIIRSRQPKRIVEIGCGWSSLLLERALRLNGNNTLVSQIEPYPNEAIFKLLPREWTHHRCILQRAPMNVFEELQAGDICFYDGSHCVTTAGDVNWFFFEVLPRLRPGVIIHIHDIFFPEEYPKQWIFDRAQSWNEQYLLQAFLMHNQAYRILIANRFLWHSDSQLLLDLYKGVQPAYGCSFWMEKVASA